jgi:mycofactocin precursor
MAESAVAVPHETTAPEEDLVEDELLVEEISIDGMCGVY